MNRREKLLTFGAFAAFGLCGWAWSDPLLSGPGVLVGWAALLGGIGGMVVLASGRVAE